MKNKILTLIICLSILALAGCAPVKIFSNPGLTEKTGLKYYSVKPFLQVERDPESNRIVKATVLYLPDIANPQYMAIKDGPGSRKFDLKLTDGSINTFGYTSGTKIAESLDALAALLSKGTTALTDLTTLKSPQGLKAVSNTVELYEIVIGTDKTFLREVVIGKE
jgi:hypothetical protein